MNIRPTYSLLPIQGVLDRKQLLHLLRRSIFGVSQRDLQFFSGKTIEECMQVLLKQSDPAPLPLQEDSDFVDPHVREGQTWVNAPYENDFIQSRRDLFLKMWWTGKIVNRDYSLTEKMSLFWHNHFVTEMVMVKDARYSYRYVQMLRKYSLGNFKSFIKEGSTNVAMLVYLSGNYSTKEAPNENYARELFELFTLGKDNASNYTEDDVREAARVLTGYVDNKDSIDVTFHPERHDSGDKKFSSFFDHHIIYGKVGNEGATEVDELVEMVFRKKETARFFCRNLYRWFVSHHIDDEVEQKIIQPLSEIFMSNNFEVAPVLKTLLSSQHFFDPAFNGCIVKNPIEHFIGAFLQFDVVRHRNLDINHESWLEFYTSIGELSMDLGNPPSVAGWPAYYQAPKFHRWWVNSASLTLRKKKLYLLSTKEGMVFNGSNMKFDFRLFLEQIPVANDADKLIDECIELLLAVDIGEDEKNRLKDILLSGQSSNRYWAEAWETYMGNKNDEVSIELVEGRLRPFFKQIIATAEYQMM